MMDADSFGLSDNVFLPTIQSQGTDEQREKWLPLIHNYKIIGAYAQTELGHGKSVHDNKVPIPRKFTTVLAV